MVSKFKLGDILKENETGFIWEVELVSQLRSHAETFIYSLKRLDSNDYLIDREWYIVKNFTLNESKNK